MSFVLCLLKGGGEWTGATTGLLTVRRIRVRGREAGRGMPTGDAELCGVTVSVLDEDSVSALACSPWRLRGRRGDSIDALLSVLEFRTACVSRAADAALAPSAFNVFLFLLALLADSDLDFVCRICGGEGIV